MLSCRGEAGHRQGIWPRFISSVQMPNPRDVIIVQKSTNSPSSPSPLPLQKKMLKQFNICDFCLITLNRKMPWKVNYFFKTVSSPLGSLLVTKCQDFLPYLLKPNQPPFWCLYASQCENPRWCRCIPGHWWLKSNIPTHRMQWSKALATGKLMSNTLPMHPPPPPSA